MKKCEMWALVVNLSLFAWQQNFLLGCTLWYVIYLNKAAFLKKKTSL